MALSPDMYKPVWFFLVLGYQAKLLNWLNLPVENSGKTSQTLLNQSQIQSQVSVSSVTAAHVLKSPEETPDAGWGDDIGGMMLALLNSASPPMSVYAV